MEGPSKVTAEALGALVSADVQRMIEEVSAAVGQAPDGQWIEASEERVRDAMAELRQQVFQKSLQLKAQAAEATFSP